jgi:hypothetical protein
VRHLQQALGLANEALRCGKSVRGFAMRIVELFAGTGNVSKAFRASGGSSFTVDIEPSLSPDLIADVTTLQVSDLPEEFQKPDVVWASPPCTCFSVMSVSRNWEVRNGIPVAVRPEAAQACYLVWRTLQLIAELKPRYWFIENPRGMLRAMPFMQVLPRKTVTYCQYGESYMKPTDIWTNCSEWNPRPSCDYGDKCHESVSRGENAGVQKLANAKRRSEIPNALAAEIVMACKGFGGNRQTSLDAFSAASEPSLICSGCGKTWIHNSPMDDDCGCSAKWCDNHAAEIER